MGKSRILLIELKHIAIVGIALLIAVFIIWGIVASINSKNDDKQKDSVQTLSENEPTYKSGVYSTDFMLDGILINLEVTLDENHINDVRFTNLTDDIKSQYPLLESTLETISSQLSSGTDINDVVISNECTYTGRLLINSINSVIDNATK